jgi:copper resistance protein C
VVKRRLVGRRRLGALAATAGLGTAVLGLIAALASPASAHASLTASKPADGATVTEAPANVELTFSEEVRRPSTVIVIAPDGKHVEIGPTQILNATAIQPLGGIATAGLYTVAYRVVSSDGHPVSGQLAFTYAPSGGGTATAAADSATPGRPSGGQGALSRHGAHLLALGILVAAALVASFIALRKDRESTKQQPRTAKQMSAPPRANPAVKPSRAALDKIGRLRSTDGDAGPHGDI